ncbi:MAG: DUF3299 domain-containing protein [Candidatus Sumerlaeia bacterium]|nr:DUF3299 domain-containing protein [Candidatus Sumerlaeia bacterium]
MNSPSPENADQPEPPRRRGIVWATRVLWLGATIFLILKIFQPEQHPTAFEPLFSDDWDVQLVAAADRPTTTTQPLSNAELHAAGHELQALQEKALERLKESGRLPDVSGDKMISFEDLMETKLYRLPPPVFTDKVAGLGGNTVRMVGFMSPYDSLTDLRNFMLVQVPTGCYFCAPPGPLQVVSVRIDSDTPVSFIEEPILVEGTLRLWEEESTNPMHRMFLFVIDKAKVTPIK